MPWILKHKRSTQPMVAEFLCPVHGRFERLVDRDMNGDPPAAAECPHRIETRPAEQFALMTCGEGTEEARWLGCHEVSPFCISNPGYAKVKAVEAVRGSYQKAERPTWTDTTNLGEGQDLDDWQDDRAKVWDRHREDEVHKMAKEL